MAYEVTADDSASPSLSTKAVDIYRFLVLYGKIDFGENYFHLFAGGNTHILDGTSHAGDLHVHLIRIFYEVWMIRGKGVSIPVALRLFHKVDRKTNAGQEKSPQFSFTFDDANISGVVSGEKLARYHPIGTGKGDIVSCILSFHKVIPLKTKFSLGQLFQFLEYPYHCQRIERAVFEEGVAYLLYLKRIVKFLHSVIYIHRHVAILYFQIFIA